MEDQTMVLVQAEIALLVAQCLLMVETQTQQDQVLDEEQ